MSQGPQEKVSGIVFPDTPKERPQVPPKKVSRKGFLAALGGLAAATGLAAWAGHELAKNPPQDPTPVQPSEPNDNDFVSPPGGYVNAQSGPTESGSGSSLPPIDLADPEAPAVPVPIHVDGNRKGPGGEDVLPMMRPINPNLITEKDGDKSA